MQLDWDDLFSMLRDMQKHALLEEVVVSDDPMTRCLGYYANQSSRGWSIHLVDVKHSLARSDLTPREQQVKDLIKTAAGRQALINNFPL